MNLAVEGQSFVNCIQKVWFIVASIKFKPHQSDRVVKKPFVPMNLKKQCMMVNEQKIETFSI